jgi:hypothetical protein
MLVTFDIRLDPGRSLMKPLRHGRPAAATVLALAALCLFAFVPAAAGATTRHLGTGTATFSLDRAQTILFFGAAIPPYPVSPAAMTFTTSAVKFTMPISGGTWSPSALQGTFLLKGGLAYVHPAATTFTVLDLTGWRAGVNNNTGFSIAANGHRSSRFFDENLMGSIPSIVTSHGYKYVKITDVLLFFNATSTAAINGAFGTTPPPGATFGSVTFLARLK